MNPILAVTLTLSLMALIILPPLQSLVITTLASAFNGTRGREFWGEFLQSYISIAKFYFILFVVLWVAIGLVLGIILLFQTLYNFFV